MILLIDADSLVYSSCYKERTILNNSEFHNIDEAKQKFDELHASIVEKIEATYEIDKVVTFNNSKGNFRKQISKTYKANRTAPKPPILNELHEYVQESYNSKSGYGIETDDLVAKYWTELTALFGRDEVMIVSIDKDYKQLPCLIYDYHYKKQSFYDISEADAKNNFYTQMIVGDTADNVNYCKGYGIAYTKKAFLDCLSDYSYIRVVYTLFKKLYKSKARERFIECYTLLKLKTN